MKLIEQAKAKEEAKKEQAEGIELEMEEREEDAYQDLLLTMKSKLHLITQEELEALQEKKKKKRWKLVSKRTPRHNFYLSWAQPHPPTTYYIAIKQRFLTRIYTLFKSQALYLCIYIIFMLCLES